jgi:hypothetical protein
VNFVLACYINRQAFLHHRVPAPVKSEKNPKFVPPDSEADTASAGNYNVVYVRGFRKETTLTIKSIAAKAHLGASNSAMATMRLSKTIQPEYKTRKHHPLDTTTLSQLDQRNVAPAPRLPTAPWTLPQRISFRFVCCYFVFYIASNIVPLAADVLPVSWLTDSWNAVWHKLVPWVAIHMFHLSGKATMYFDTGSGDTTLETAMNFQRINEQSFNR